MEMGKKEKREEEEKKWPACNWTMALPCGTLISEFTLKKTLCSTSFSDYFGGVIYI